MMHIPAWASTSAEAWQVCLGVSASTYADAIGRELWDEVQAGDDTTVTNIEWVS